MMILTPLSELASTILLKKSNKKMPHVIIPHPTYLMTYPRKIQIKLQSTLSSLVKIIVILMAM
jgi:hypothetical protein